MSSSIITAPVHRWDELVDQIKGPGFAFTLVDLIPGLGQVPEHLPGATIAHAGLDPSHQDDLFATVLICIHI